MWTIKNIAFTCYLFSQKSWVIFLIKSSHKFLILISNIGVDLVWIFWISNYYYTSVLNCTSKNIKITFKVAFLQSVIWKFFIAKFSKMHLTAEILEFFYLADNENQKLFFPEWKIFVLKRFLFSFFFLPYLTLFFSFSSSRNHSSPSSTDIYTFICVTKPLKSFPICFRFCALPAFQSLKSKLLDPPGFAPRFRFSSFEASNSILTFHVFRGIEFYFEEEKTFLLFDSSFLFCVYKNGFFSLHYQKKARWKQR